MIDKKLQIEDYGEDKTNNIEDSAASSSSLNDGNNEPLSMPLAGGPSVIFAMAQRMLIWDRDTSNDALSSTNTANPSTANNNNNEGKRGNNRTLPRWHPH